MKHKSLVLSISLGALTTAGALAACAALLLSTEAAVPAPAGATPGTFAQVQPWLRALDMRQLLAGGLPPPVHLHADAAQLQPLVAEVAQRLGRSNARLSLQPGRATVQLAVPVRHTPLRALAPLWPWLNVRAVLQQRPAGLPELVALRVGHVPLPAAWAQAAAARWLQAQPVAAQWELARQAVEKLELQTTGVALHVRWQPQTQARVRQLLLPAEQAQRLKPYLQALGPLLAAPGPQAQLPLPLNLLLSGLLGQARQRTAAAAAAAAPLPVAELAALARQENQAALMALALYAGGLNLQHLAPLAAPAEALPRRELQLRGRADHAHHFLMSAAMASGAGGVRLAQALGLYKELADAGAPQGSGFSFDDLLADRAGLQFGLRARDQPLALQRVAALMLDDTLLMPSAEGLPQPLTATEFTRTVGHADSGTYNALVAEIDKRVQGLVLYQARP